MKNNWGSSVLFSIGANSTSDEELLAEIDLDTASDMVVSFQGFEKTGAVDQIQGKIYWGVSGFRLETDWFDVGSGASVPVTAASIRVIGRITTFGSPGSIRLGAQISYGEIASSIPPAYYRRFQTGAESVTEAIKPFVKEIAFLGNVIPNTAFNLATFYDRSGAIIASAPFFAYDQPKIRVPPNAGSYLIETDGAFDNYVSVLQFFEL